MRYQTVFTHKKRQYFKHVFLVLMWLCFLLAGHTQHLTVGRCWRVSSGMHELSHVPSKDVQTDGILCVLDVVIICGSSLLFCLYGQKPCIIFDVFSFPSPCLHMSSNELVVFSFLKCYCISPLAVCCCCCCLTHYCKSHNLFSLTAAAYLLHFICHTM